MNLTLSARPHRRYPLKTFTKRSFKNYDLQEAQKAKKAAAAAAK